MSELGYRQGLWAVGGKTFGQAMSQTNHTRRPVSRIQQDIQDVHLTGIGQGFRQVLLKLLLCSDHDADASTDQIANPLVVPVVKVVEGSFEDFTFGRISAIVQNNPDRRRLMTPC